MAVESIHQSGLHTQAGQQSHKLGIDAVEALAE
jgi:hypothetical protein